MPTDSNSPPCGPAERAALFKRLRDGARFDLLVIGGGATGLGVALDAATRGFSVLLAEAGDFAQGTSSRATKLVHGGVRYLAQGNIALVREALKERAALLANAPHVAHRLPFIVPGYHLWEPGWYGMGLKVYDTLAGRRGIGDTRWLSASRTLELLPAARPEGLSGGVRYWDGQFDDARLAVLLARTAAARGAGVLNHARLVGLRQDKGQLRAVQLEDAETQERFEVQAGCVVNATGVWVDAVRNLDRAEGQPAPQPMVAPSQGVHLVVDRSFLPGGHALMVPRTEDGRVLFAVPWLGKTILGTTDTPREDITAEPRPFGHEVDFILREAARYLRRAPQRGDVRSAWVGLRPLVRPADDGGDTKSISREHTISVSRSGLVTVTGGKWTTYRAMAEDVLSRCMSRGLLSSRSQSVTEHLPLLGAAPGRPLADPPGEHLYGSEAASLRALPGADRWIWRDAESGQGGLTEAMVRFAVRHEMARSVTDVLARRSRLLFLDARLAGEVAPQVADLLSEELGSAFDAPASLSACRELAQTYARLD
ncbi:MAG: glycerol-3-phosphate dehydrogenase/oxidase [Rubrivivax sp.]|nr:glycerol-3-phosphate dehydrogenase/oxidase [Rubrivivax sp.]